MTTFEKIEKLLRENQIDYKIFHHEPVITSEQAAAVRKDISLSQGAKALIVKCKPKNSETFFLMIVVPGDKKFDSKKVKKLYNLKDLNFASEEEIAQITNGVERGGVPPFGNLFGIKMVCEKLLLDNEEIAFNAGDRSITILMKSEDWVRITNPEICDVINNM